MTDLARGPEVGCVHGYSAYEASRLADQAATLGDLLHAGTAYPRGAMVLEADWAKTLAGLEATAAENGTFHYTFCKVTATAPGRR